MRDFLLNEALKRLAADAAVRLSALVAGGEQIPFDVAEEDGPESAFYLYEPQTSRFVLEREEELRALPAFVPARDAADAAGAAAPYLEACGEKVPADPRERAARMLVVFLASLWEGCTEFSLDRERLDAALAQLDAEARDADDAEVLIAPVVGLKMALPNLQLPHGVRLIRADAIEAPVEAMRSEGMGRASWEPQYLAVAEQDDEADSAASAMHQLHELISVMRLFKAGGIGLGPYAFAPTGSGHWSRIPTGAAATRPGGYLLSKDDAERLADLAVALEARPDPDGALSWAVARFEMGCARESALEGLSDHLLALRAVLEGHGPVGASLPMRASALISDETCDRIEARGRVESALELERALMNGAADHGRPRAGRLDRGGRPPDAARRRPRRARHRPQHRRRRDPDRHRPRRRRRLAIVGTDFIRVAKHPTPERLEITVARSHEHATSEDDPDHGADPRGRRDPHRGAERSEQEEPPIDFRIMEPVPAEDEIRITATNWLDEVSVEKGTMEWTAAEGDVGHRERVDTPRVRHLFQVPEDADWEVRELNYDHYRARLASPVPAASAVRSSLLANR